MFVNKEWQQKSPVERSGRLHLRITPDDDNYDHHDHGYVNDHIFVSYRNNVVQ